MAEKLANIIANEAMQGETLKYWQGRVWPADEIIRDLNEQIPLKGRMMCVLTLLPFDAQGAAPSKADVPVAGSAASQPA